MPFSPHKLLSIYKNNNILTLNLFSVNDILKLPHQILNNKEVKSVLRIKERLKALNKTQVWLVFALRERGYNIQPPLLSSVISGAYTYPMAQSILKTCDEILTEVENTNVD